MSAFNPTASARDLMKDGLLLENLHFSLYQSFAARADLEPGSQQLIIGGIGSGKTTELLMAENWLHHQEHCIPRYIDITAETDLSDLKSGALIAALGLDLIRLARPIEKALSLSEQEISRLDSAKNELKEFALGKTIRTWVPEEDFDYEPDPDDYYEDGPAGHYEITNVPGKLDPPIPQLKKDVQGIRQSLKVLLHLITKHGSQKRDMIVLFDGLDRLMTPDKFWSVAHQDLRILKQLKVSVLATAPLAILYEGREIAEHFDRIHHLAAISTEGQNQTQLESVLLKRGGDLLLNKEQMAQLCLGSGGVLRDLITLARDAAEEAYIAGANRVEAKQIESAIDQLGTSYLRGLGARQRTRLRMMNKTMSFDVTQHVNVQLLATRRVLEYSATDFGVHPALLRALSKLEKSSD